MKKLSLLLLISVLLSCSKNPESLIKYMNGYWEIDEVTLPDGTKRDYNYNDTIDFISITDSLNGFRKKIKPNLDGTFSTSNDVESLKIVIEHDSLNVYYTTPYSKWKETVLDASDTKLLIQNKDKLLYLYKRYVPLDLN